MHPLAAAAILLSMCDISSIQPETLSIILLQQISEVHFGGPSQRGGTTEKQSGFKQKLKAVLL